MSTLSVRTPTALVYGLVVLAVSLGPRELFLAGLAIGGALALIELVALRRAGLPALLQLVVLAAGLAALLFLRDLTAFPFGALLMTILAVWAADVTAYLVGASIGRRRIAPRISPGKTWEGTIAGSVAAALVVVVAAAGIVVTGPPFIVHPWWIASAVLVGPAAFLGDLLESWVKRRAGVKDSGTLLPGHGGLLDRIDSLLAAAVAVAGSIVLSAFLWGLG